MPSLNNATISPKSAAFAGFLRMSATLGWQQKGFERYAFGLGGARRR